VLLPSSVVSSLLLPSSVVSSLLLPSSVVSSLLLPSFSPPCSFPSCPQSHAQSLPCHVSHTSRSSRGPRRMSIRSRYIHQQIDRVVDVNPLQPLRPPRHSMVEKHHFSLISQLALDTALHQLSWPDSHGRAMSFSGSLLSSQTDFMACFNHSIELPIASSCVVSTQSTPSSSTASLLSPLSGNNTDQSSSPSKPPQKLQSPAWLATSETPAWVDTSRFRSFSTVLSMIYLQSAEALCSPRFELRRIAATVSSCSH
jgi:hypothetical protein